ITVHISSGFTDGGTLSNTASIATLDNNTADPDTSNNHDTASVTVNRSADLKVTKTASPSPATAGTDETYTITVKNQGPSDNAGYTLKDVLPAGTSFVSASAGRPGHLQQPRHRLGHGEPLGRPQGHQDRLAKPGHDRGPDYVHDRGLRRRALRR
ncbi:MAG: DUF11 domain-containing protein, partial [Actinobacteria bacterium]|nr:DUF11 domain-containing protein [Actinomycetota bacterium]